MRLFLAFPLTPDVRDELTRVMTTLSRQMTGIKWVAPESLHLTVRFLGETDSRTCDDVGRLVERLAANFPTYQGNLTTELGAFPSLARPRAIWAGVTGIEMVEELVQRIEVGVQGIGFEPETKKWSPHLTLGRARDGAHPDTAPLRQVRVAPLPVRLDELVLYESRLGPGGAVYERVASHRLGAERFS